MCRLFFFPLIPAYSFPINTDEHFEKPSLLTV